MGIARWKVGLLVGALSVAICATTLAARPTTNLGSGIPILRGLQPIYDQTSESGLYADPVATPNSLGYPGKDPDSTTHEQLFVVERDPRAGRKIIEAAASQAGAKYEGSEEFNNVSWRWTNHLVVSLDPPGPHTTKTYVRVSLHREETRFGIFRRWLRSCLRAAVHKPAPIVVWEGPYSGNPSRSTWWD